MRQKAEGLLSKEMSVFCRCRRDDIRKLQEEVVERMHMLQRQVFMALTSVTVVVMVRIPEVGSQESKERNRFSLFSSYILV